MAKEQNVKYMRTALSLIGLPIDEAGADMIIQTYEGIIEKGEFFSLGDVNKIRESIQEKYKK